MEDRHITGGDGHVLLATLAVPGALRFPEKIEGIFSILREAVQSQ